MTLLWLGSLLLGPYIWALARWSGGEKTVVLFARITDVALSRMMTRAVRYGNDTPRQFVTEDFPYVADE